MTANLPSLPKAPTGILGLDEVTGGGLPRGRSTLVCGPAGCGKTLLAMEFLVRGIVDYDEPGVFVAFEETAADLVANVSSLGYDLAGLEADGRLVLDHMSVSPDELEEIGEWDLEGLFVRLGAAIDEVGARRVVLDTLESLFGAFTNTAILRAELRRLFAFLKDRGVTAIITGERGDGALTRHGIEEYVSDCVIVLDHRVSEQTSTRRLRVLKYRGSLHGTNEYPFLIGARGVSVLPITSLGLEHAASAERVSTGVDRLDVMLGGSGFFRGSSILVSGSAGTGKSTLSAQFCDAACRRGEKALYFAFEESESQIIRNMASVGMDLAPWVRAGLLQFRCARPSVLGLEAHLAAMQQLVGDLAPDVVVIDPISDLAGFGTGGEVAAMLTRQVDYLKGRGITAMFTSLASGRGREGDEQIASLIDTCLLLREVEANGEFNRLLYVLKSRGMAHSHQIREFLLTDSGIRLADVYVGENGVLTGTAGAVQSEREATDATERREELEQLRVDLQRRRESVEAGVAGLWREYAAQAETVDRLLRRGRTRASGRTEQRARLGRLRGVDDDRGHPQGGTGEDRPLQGGTGEDRPLQGGTGEDRPLQGGSAEDAMPRQAGTTPAAADRLEGTRR